MALTHHEIRGSCLIPIGYIIVLILESITAIDYILLDKRPLSEL